MFFLLYFFQKKEQYKYSEYETKKLDSFKMSFFRVTSGAIRASDPCYELIDSSCADTFKAKNGLWKADIELSDEGSWGKRVAVLKIQHEDFDRVKSSFIVHDNKLCVDSGQFGFFDDNYFREHVNERDCEWEENIIGWQGEEPNRFPICEYVAKPGAGFYTECCVATLNAQFGIIANRGAVSSSGFGDGSYPIIIYEDENGEAVKMEVVFIHDALARDDELFEEAEEVY